jgi:hypothetical protein
MSEYMNLELEDLIDLLVARTRDYDVMLSTRVFNEEEFAQCKQTLAELHAAIKVKAQEEGYNTNNISPNFPDNEFRHRNSKYGVIGLPRNNDANK